MVGANGAKDSTVGQLLRRQVCVSDGSPNTRLLFTSVKKVSAA